MALLLTLCKLETFLSTQPVAAPDQANHAPNSELVWLLWLSCVAGHAANPPSA